MDGKVAQRLGKVAQSSILLRGELGHALSPFIDLILLYS
jgi:hypothetical protein